jgi:hypothetical protein
MKLRNSAIAAILGVASAGVILPVVAQTTVPAAPQATNSTAQEDRFINAINSAQDPSTAINAYADAKAAEPNNLAVQQAYLRKMVAFQLPEMAEAQARDIINRDTRDPIAWAVLAYMHAKEDLTTQALTEIAVAVQRAPDDPFVMRTAGQLLAWYDTKADKSQIPEALKNSLEGMRRDLAGRPIFADTYAKATEAYRAPASTEPTPGTADTTYVAPPPASTYTPTQYPSYPTYTSYPQTAYDYPYYASYSSPFYEPWYPYGYYPGFIIVSSGFGFHHHHHHDFDHDHDFDHGHGHDHHDGIVGDALPLVHPHHHDGVVAAVVARGNNSGSEVTIRTPHRGIAAEPFVSPSAGVREDGGTRRSIEIIRPSERVGRAEPSVIESHTPSRLRVESGASIGVRPAAPSTSVPMRSSAPMIAPSAPHFTAPAPAPSHSVPTGGGVAPGAAQPAAGGRR